MNSSSQSAEEAGTIVSEYISSLDNVPHEVNFLLTEIRIKDARSQELALEISRDQTKYVKQALLGSGISTDFQLASGGSNIDFLYSELSQLASEKIALAERLIELLNRTKSRLDVEATRVKILQGESDEPRRRPKPTKRQHDLLISQTYTGDGHSQTRQITDSLIQALNPADSIVLEPPYKKQRAAVTATSSPRKVSPGPVLSPSVATTPVAPPLAGTQSRRSLTPRLSSTRGTTSRSRLREMYNAVIHDDIVDAGDDPDADAEGDPEEEEEDTALYCICNRQSFGDMIGCDNPKCPYQWFHISCVGVKTPLPDKWYCMECSGKGFNGRATNNIQLNHNGGTATPDGKKRGRK
ncbi:hypothetical protein C8J56DRAFT_950831 [Mycena floridula]|nr:hypothetical protein C8J56DRAFT_950831 [Mycena floridula]